MSLKELDYLFKYSKNDLEPLSKQEGQKLINLKHEGVVVKLCDIHKEGFVTLLDVEVKNEIPNYFNFPYLEILQILGDEIENTDFLKHNPNLKDLTISYCNLKGMVSVENLNKLEKLNLRHNQISKIEGLTNLTKLKKLDLQYNQISKIEGLENLINLTSLNLSHNQIRQIEGLDTLSSLEFLKLNANQLSLFLDCPRFKMLLELN